MDMYSSSKPMTFFEVYSGNNAFFGGERCGSGIWFTNAFFDQRMTYAVDIYRPENDDNGVQFQNSDIAGILRLTALPLWQNDGRCFMHIGGSATWRRAQNGVVSFATDPEMRDRSGGDNGYGSPLSVTPVIVGTKGAAQQIPPVGLGGQTLTNNAATVANGGISGVKAAPGNANNWVSTGSISADASVIFAPEFLFNYGPFSIQAEYDWAFIDHAIIGGKQQGNLGFTGGYAQVGYFFTGENRQYDKRLGRLNSEYISRPNTPFWLVRGEDSRINWGLGAWEIAGRYSHLDLNSGPTTAFGGPLVNGGILDQWEGALNWHLNNNFRIQFVYLHADRYGFYGPNAAPAAGKAAATVGAPSDTWMNAFGIRTQLTF